VHRSCPVASIVRRALQDSDNLCAEQLLRATAIGNGDSGHWLSNWSAAYISAHCHVGTQSRASPLSPPPSMAPGVSSPHLCRVHLVDGSGLSRHNLASPRAFVALLLAMLEGARREQKVEEEEAGAPEYIRGKQPAAEGEKDSKQNQQKAQEAPRTGRATATAPARPCSVFLDSLPLAARTGTLSRRLVGTPAAGTVRAKTGTMTGVAALSGVYQPPCSSPSLSVSSSSSDGLPVVRPGCCPDPTGLGALVFSIIANNAVGSADRDRLRAVIDEVVVLITLARGDAYQPKP